MSNSPNRPNEPVSDRLKGALVFFAIVFAILVLSGGPDESSADPAATVSPAITTPGNPSWDF